MMASLWIWEILKTFEETVIFILNVYTSKNFNVTDLNDNDKQQQVYSTVYRQLNIIMKINTNYAQEPMAI